MIAFLLAAGVAASPAPAATAARPKTDMHGDLVEKLRVHVHTLAGQFGERNAYHVKSLRQARDHILVAFSDYGYNASTQPYQVWGGTFENITAVLPGTDPKAGMLVVGAHYDTAPDTPGADDNASGVAGLLELARLMKGRTLSRTVVFVAFGSEEPPFFGTELMGSRVWARAARERGDRIEGMISLEMIGYYDKAEGSQTYPPGLSLFYPDTADFISVVANLGSRGFQMRLKDALKKNSKMPLQYATLPAWVPGVDWSDHASFWKEGYAAVMLTDTSFYRNKHYHERTDTPDKLDYESMAVLIEGLAGALEELGK